MLLHRMSARCKKAQHLEWVSAKGRDYGESQVSNLGTQNNQGIDRGTRARQNSGNGRNNEQKVS